MICKRIKALKANNNESVINCSSYIPTLGKVTWSLPVCQRSQAMYKVCYGMYILRLDNINLPWPYVADVPVVSRQPFDLLLLR